MNLEQLIKKCAKNDIVAQQELYNRYKDTLFVLSLKYCKNTEEAEDNLQNAFLEIFNNIKKFNHTGSFEGWMKRITINKAIDSYKKACQMIPISNHTFPDTAIDESEMENFSLDYILSLIQELPNQYRLVFSLYELDHFSHAEIAEMLSISVGTSKSNLHRAKMILKEQIKSNKPVAKVNMKYE
ncbi:RNA polymerase sigma factor [Flavobacterium sp.]|uniref:RNA polymerase sigma factor n=1 Tax=Flavobacterium sp. TaxID=239 RepID=UPI002FDE180C